MSVLMTRGANTDARIQLGDIAVNVLTDIVNIITTTSALMKMSVLWLVTFVGMHSVGIRLGATNASAQVGNSLTPTASTVSR